MALQKDKNTVFDVIANYHKIIRIDLNAMDWSGIVLLATYKDQLACDDNKSPMETQNIQLDPGVYAPENMAISNAVSLSYTWIKANVPFFSDAIDV